MYLSIKSLASWIVVGLCLFLITSVQELRFLFDLDRIARKFERKGREDGAQGKPAISDGAVAVNDFIPRNKVPVAVLVSVFPLRSIPVEITKDPKPSGFRS